MDKEFLPPLQKALLITVVGTTAMLASAPAQIWQITFAPYMWMVNEEGLVLLFVFSLFLSLLVVSILFLKTENLLLSLKYQFCK